MSDHCHHGSCSHHHHEEEYCDCCGKKSHECSCCCQEEHPGHYSDELLALADEAWFEVLKEKIKEQIEKTSGKNLDAMAKLVSEANHERWKGKMAETTARSEFDAKLQSLFQHKK